MNRTGKFCKNIFSALFASVSHNKKSTSGNVKLAGWNWRPRIHTKYTLSLKITNRWNQRHTSATNLRNYLAKRSQTPPS